LFPLAVRTADPGKAERDWKPEYDLAAMTADMLAALEKRRDAGTLGD
jgi:hypothetical protein